MEHQNETKFTVDDVSPRGDLFPSAVPVLGEFCSIKEKICDFGTVPFLYGLYRAYAHHCPLRLSPDDFWLLILQDFSNYINVYSEELRNKIVDFEGKKELLALIPKFVKSDLVPQDYMSIVTQLVDQIPKNIKNPKLVEAMNPRFTTSDNNNMYVKKLSVMCSFKKYFNYRAFLCGCGIPSITLTGSVEDWEKIILSMDKLSSLDPHLKEMKPIMEKIVETKKGKIDISFWKSMIKKEVIKKPIYGGSGMYMGEKDVDYITGWILKFFQFNKEEKEFHSEKLEIDDIKDLASQVLTIPFILEDYYHNKYNMEYLAGFLGMKQDPKTFEVSSAIGWYLQEVKKQ